jgi:hypothetical protein
LQNSLSSVKSHHLLTEAFSDMNQTNLLSFRKKLKTDFMQFWKIVVPLFPTAQAFIADVSRAFAEKTLVTSKAFGME